jgi:23S rRNA pseudouridine1911/1915/1917 synthase
LLADADSSLTRSAATRLIRTGKVRLNGRAARAADPVKPGDVIEYELADAQAREPSPEPIPLRVVYEDADLLVIDKPAGMVVHPAAGHWSGTVVHALLGRGGTWSTVGGEERPGIVHRLDKGTSGLMVVARNDTAHRSLAAQLADHSLARAYLALVRGVLKSEAGVLEGDIARDPRDRKRMAVVGAGRFARTRYSVRERFARHTLLRCDLDTGRTHQIRVHLSALGHPIVGDAQYGRRQPGEPPRPLLHAWQLRFRHPVTGDEVRFEAPLPTDFSAYLRALKEGRG